MGCGHSIARPVDLATTGDELSKPQKGSIDASQRQDFQEPTEPISTVLEPPSVVPDRNAAASSSAARVKRGRTSKRNLAQSEQHLDASSSAIIAPSVPIAVAGPVEPPLSGGEAGRATPSGTPPHTAQKLTAASSHVSKSDPSRKALPLRLLSQATQASSLSDLATSAAATNSSQAQQQPIESPDDLVQTVLPGVMKDLLTRISTPQQSGVDNRKLVLIVWDIENVRCPRGNGSWDPVLTPSKVLGFIKEHFIFELGRMEYRTVAAVTPKSLNMIRKMYSDFVEQMVPDLTLLVASAEEPKRNADVMLKKELYRFVSEHAHIARIRPGQLTVVLLSGDEDFLEPVQVALNSGFAVELVHHDQPSWALRSQQGYARPPLLWSEFLKQRSGATQVNLPYQRKQ